MQDLWGMCTREDHKINNCICSMTLRNLVVYRDPLGPTLVYDRVHPNIVRGSEDPMRFRSGRIYQRQWHCFEADFQADKDKPHTYPAISASRRQDLITLGLPVDEYRLLPDDKVLAYE